MENNPAVPARQTKRRSRKRNHGCNRQAQGDFGALDMRRFFGLERVTAVVSARRGGQSSKSIPLVVVKGKRRPGGQVCGKSDGLDDFT